MPFLPFLRAAALSLGCVGAAWAQSAPAAATADSASAPATQTIAAAAPASAPVAPPAIAGVKSANIFEIAPDAATAAGYAEQTNGERARVQPGNNAPVWRAVGGGVTGYSSLPKSEAPEAGNLIQPMVQYPGSSFTNAGEAWRQVRNHWLLPYGAALLGIVVLALVIFLFTVGPLGHKEAKDTPRPIERFTPFERAAHWVNAAAFVTLAVSGLTMAFGKFFLLPVLGLHFAGWLTYLLKNVHNFVGPAFAVSLVVVILTFIKDNFPNASDIRWLVKLGGLFSHEHVPSGRFNLGEKGVFWFAVTLLGLTVVASGLVLNKLVPGIGELRADMQVSHMVHLAAALFMMALILGHIYMGTVGMYGAYNAMKTGYVSEEWAREHHQLWYDDIVAGKVPAQRSGRDTAPAPASSTT